MLHRRSNFQEAVAPAQRALPFLQSIKTPHIAANTAVNLAEAYCALIEAEQLLQIVIG